MISTKAFTCYTFILTYTVLGGGGFNTVKQNTPIRLCWK